MCRLSLILRHVEVWKCIISLWLSILGMGKIGRVSKCICDLIYILCFVPFYVFLEVLLQVMIKGSADRKGRRLDY